LSGDIFRCYQDDHLGESAKATGFSSNKAVAHSPSHNIGKPELGLIAVVPEAHVGRWGQIAFSN
jgi:hypothetical protein